VGRFSKIKEQAGWCGQFLPTCDVASVLAYRAAVLSSNLEELFQAGVHQVNVVLVDLDLRSGLAVPVEVQLDGALLIVRSGNSLFDDVAVIVCGFLGYLF
jgi:hypothetical protein